MATHDFSLIKLRLLSFLRPMFSCPYYLVGEGTYHLVLTKNYLILRSYI